MRYTYAPVYSTCTMIILMLHTFSVLCKDFCASPARENGCSECQDGYKEPNCCECDDGYYRDEDGTCKSEWILTFLLEYFVRVVGPWAGESMDYNIMFINSISLSWK